MARKIKAKLIMELRGQGVSRRAVASTRRMSMESVCEVFNIAAGRQIAWEQVRDMPDDEARRGRPIEVQELALRPLPPGSQRRVKSSMSRYMRTVGSDTPSSLATWATLSPASSRLLIDRMVDMPIISLSGLLSRITEAMTRIGLALEMVGAFVLRETFGVCVSR